MDYSLLIGVRKVPISEPLPAGTYGVSIFQQFGGGFRPGSSKESDLDEVYHIGIIDCLTNYGLRKKFANMFKSMRWKQVINYQIAIADHSKGITFYCRCRILCQSILHFYEQVSRR